MRRFPFHDFLKWTLCAGTLAVLVACGKPPAETAAPTNDDPEAIERIALPVQVLRAGSGTISDVIEVQARLEATKRQEIVSLSNGIITELPVVNGQIVDVGELLVELRPLPEDEDQLIDATIELKRAQRDLERLQDLEKKVAGAVAQVDLDEALDKRDDATLAVKKAERDAANRRIVAPFRGVISGIEAILGERLDKSDIFARLQNLDSFTTTVEIPETIVPRLEVGLSVDVIPLGDEQALGKILTMPASIDHENGTGNVQVKIDTPPATWRPGAFALMRIKANEVSGDVVLPRICVQYRRNRAFVWEMLPEDLANSDDMTAESNWIVKRTWVSLGAGDEDQVVIADGLRPGALVIRDGNKGLSDKVPVVPQGLEDYHYIPDPSANEETAPQRPQGPGGRPGRPAQGS